MNEEAKELKQAYIEGVKLNKLKKKLLSQLHQKTDNVVDKYLFVPHANPPSFKQVQELFYFIRAIAGIMPRSILRIVTRPRGRAIGIAKGHNMYTGKSSNRTVTGRRQSIRYYYYLDGKCVTRQDIANKKGITLSLVTARLKAVENGADVSNVNFSYINRGWSQKQGDKK